MPSRTPNSTITLDGDDDPECSCSRLLPCEWQANPTKPCTCCESCFAAAGEQCAALPLEDEQ